MKSIVAFGSVFIRNSFYPSHPPYSKVAYLYIINMLQRQIYSYMFLNHCNIFFVRICRIIV